MFGIPSEKRFKHRRPEDHEHLLADDDRSPLESRPTKQGLSWTTVIITVFCTAIISAACGAFATQHIRLNADNFSIRHTSQYCKPPPLITLSKYQSHLAPIVKDVGVTYTPVQFEGSLMKSNAFRLDAGPEVDAAWKSLGADCTCSLPQSNV